ncbi:uncharacterized protein STEHIDRAFT_111056 [Stereum hirsutum FP-91666 SS1]|uniref:uncharacterized protein n=1 Tax=Stereum hirsutum (strain FP-91666) TaxID=721885 RepID=UPI000440A65C|nr:uncharacterized protein STEHIDRAFT_111056 [Stereum hirsutum FP-91666 SS1]EIM86578.1 hypothetical protein STEHIDRAFT_111056 [Stereum hirsutum FP-91666 SS1]
MSHAAMLCDSVTSIAVAVSALSSSPTIILDCEGLNLGARGGTLSIIILRTTTTTSPARTFLLDVLQLSQSQLQPVYALLSSPFITKLVFDGRMDYSALYHECGIELRNVLDLQLADVVSRGLRGEGEGRRMERLGSFLGRWEVEGKKERYGGVHKLNGMKDCLWEHEIYELEKDGSVRHDLWLCRPLPRYYAGYAATDAEMIHALYDIFIEGSFITSNLPAQSMRYITIWKDRQPGASDSHLRHPLLPLEILEAPDDGASESSMRACDTCSRLLSEKAFVREPGVPRRVAVSSQKCKVCLAIAVRNGETGASYNQGMRVREQDFEDMILEEQERAEREMDEFDDWYTEDRIRLEEETDNFSFGEDEDEV